MAHESDRHSFHVFLCEFSVEIMTVTVDRFHLTAVCCFWRFCYSQFTMRSVTPDLSMKRKTDTVQGVLSFAT